MALDAYICVVEVNMDLNWRIFWHWTLYYIHQFHNLGKPNNCLNQTFICFVDFLIPQFVMLQLMILKSFLALWPSTFNLEFYLLYFVNWCYDFFSFLVSSALPLLVVNVFFLLMFSRVVLHQHGDEACQWL
jgi:hypothetical protein